MKKIFYFITIGIFHFVGNPVAGMPGDDWKPLSPVHYKVVDGKDTIVKEKGPVEPPEFWWSASGDQIWFHGQNVPALRMVQLYQHTVSGPELRSLNLSGLEIPMGHGSGLIRAIPQKRVTYGVQVPGPGQYSGEIRYPINPREYYAWSWEYHALWFHAWSCESCSVDVAVRMRICIEPQFGLNVNLATCEVVVEGESLGLATITNAGGVWSADFFVAREYYDSLAGPRWTQVKINNPSGDFWYNQMFFFDGFLGPCQ